MFSAVPRFAQIAAIVVLAAASCLTSFDDANARRAGGFSGFGSRGTRTFDAPAITRTAPTQAAPIDRTMTPRTQPQTATQPPINTQQRPGLFNGFGGSMIGGLIAGGLLGMLIGHGFGGGFGFLGMLLQVVLIFLAIRFAIQFFANRQQTRYAAPGSNASYNANASQRPSFSIPPIGGGTATAAPKTRQANDEIGLSQADLDRFEQLLTEIQSAYGSEDYATLRRLATPEAMSYLAEELGENATKGVRNSVTNVRLLQGDIAEAWREGGAEYATLAMRYSSIDALVDRTTGRLVDGDDRNASETTEIWTFVRKPGSDWKLSAIQGTELHRA
ncbi:Tim44 domain-containing protein [Rhizobium calliandrae]|uniref:Tim44 domain-containing protein n=1 Tax=Rhizobium calliandrae TaxID=1312182 RepID=A0ABT7KBC8_9HYPH|nr:Tim44 domain-containing protein [Rhizobium calliandrae]MDL2405862.1 Tim44 domain-containing protein [Rhizobium calliandrae]